MKNSLSLSLSFNSIKFYLDLHKAQNRMNKNRFQVAMDKRIEDEKSDIYSHSRKEKEKEKENLIASNSAIIEFLIYFFSW